MMNDQSVPQFSYKIFDHSTTGSSLHMYDMFAYFAQPLIALKH